MHNHPNFQRIFLCVVIVAVLASACTVQPSPSLQTPQASVPEVVRTAPKPEATTETPAAELASATPTLTWDSLKNATYPNEQPRAGVAPLTDGAYREPYTPDSATRLTIQLSYVHAYGDLNGDSAEDAVVVIIADPGGSGTFYYLSPVLNVAGQPRPLPPAFLGDRVFIRQLAVENGDVVIELDIAGPQDPACCPTDSRRFVYTLQDSELIVTAETDLANPAIAARLDDPPQYVALPPGETTLVLTDAIAFNRINSYILQATEGQRLTVALTSPHDDVWLSIRGTEGGTLASIVDETTTWSGDVPATQAYVISAVATSSDTTYTVEIELTGEGIVPSVWARVNTDRLNVRLGPGTGFAVLTVIRRDETYAVSGRDEGGTWLQLCCFNGQSGWVSAQFVALSDDTGGIAVPTDVPTPLPAAQEGGAPTQVLYLTFDDGPVDPRWTPQVLDVLARNEAQATFFVLGQQAAAFPDLIAAIVADGHVVANHTYDHHTLSGIGREAFFNEVLESQATVGDAMAMCLRPPYGATDAYTRAYAAELGYEVLLWDIDTEDWRRPGADIITQRVLNQAQPGAVVLMHDGGGDRAQTVAALEAALPQLREQGFRFDTLCG